MLWNLLINPRPGKPGESITVPLHLHVCSLFVANFRVFWWLDMPVLLIPHFLDSLIWTQDYICRMELYPRGTMPGLTSSSSQHQVQRSKMQRHRQPFENM